MSDLKETRKTTYEKWMDQEGVSIIEGYGVDDVQSLSRKPWPRMGGLGAFIQLKGMEGITGMYIAEIPPGKALNPEKHLYEEIIYILKGIGSTEVWVGNEPKRRFEWAEGSLFSSPLNTWHRLYNGSREPVILLGFTNAPLVMDIFHNTDMIFSNDYVFTDRYQSQEDYFAVGRRIDRGGPRCWVWDTNLIPDVRTAPIDPQERKGAGVHVTIFEMAENALVGHLAEWPVGRYHKAHYHGGGAVLLILKSKGYTLMWPRDLGIHPFTDGHEDRVVRVNWQVGSVYSPPTAWFHQHYNTGPVPARQLAIRYGSIQYRVGVWEAFQGTGALETLQDGGTIIDYSDEDPKIRSLYEEAVRREGILSQMPPVARKQAPAT